MLIASLVVIVLIIGLLMYLGAKNPDLKEIGRLSFAAAIFAICFQTATRLVTILGR